MGRIIICETELSEKPFIFENTQVKIFSYEELCYYIYHNTILISKEEFQKNFTDWLSNEINMLELGQKVERLLREDVSLEVIYRAVLEAANYYDATEIAYFFERLKGEKALPQEIYLKKKADAYLKYHKYIRAMRIYKSILENKQLDVEFVSKIYHNIGIVFARNFEYEEAEKYFLKAYQKHENEVSLKCILLIHEITQKTEENDIFCERIGVDREKGRRMEQELVKRQQELEKIKTRPFLELLTSDKNNGKMADYYCRIENQIQEWKHEYREEMN